MQRNILNAILALYMTASLGCGGGTGSTLSTPGGGPVGPGNPPPAAGSGSFAATGNVVIPRDWGVAATRLADGRVLLTGGIFPSQPVAATAELYDPASGTFQTTGNMVTVRTHHTATLLANGKVLIAGGLVLDPGCEITIDNDCLISTDNAELYDPVTEDFTPTGELTVARNHHSATLMNDGRVLIVGGGGGAGTAELYDPATGIFAPTGPLVFARTFHTATLLSSGKVLIAGGFIGPSAAELYNPATGTFTATGSLAQPRLLHTATLLQDGRVLITAGESGDAGETGELLATAEVYDPTSGTFALTGNTTKKRSTFAAALLASGKVLIAGGWASGGEGCPDDNCVGPSSSAELYDPASGTFAPAASMGVSRVGPTATLLSSGAVLVVGGRQVNHAELFRE